MPITGQFGKSTGGSSLSGTIASIASEYVSLRLTRIYNAFINGETLDGKEMTALNAIELLNALMKGASTDSRTGMDVTETIRAVRKANRTRILNNIDADLNDSGAEKGDYANKVRVIREMLLDPTINPDDKTTLQNELNQAVEQLLENSSNQFSAGGKITVNGSTIDFTGFNNQDKLLALYDQQIQSDPTSSKWKELRNDTLAIIAIGEANKLYDSKKRVTDEEKFNGFGGQLKILQDAYDNLASIGAQNTDKAQELLSLIRSTQDNLHNAEQSINTTAANERLAIMQNDMLAGINDIDKVLQATGNEIGSDKLSAWIASGSNMTMDAVLNAIDNAIGANGGKSTMTIDGKEISFSRDDLFHAIKEYSRSARSYYEWSRNNDSVSETVQQQIKENLIAANAAKAMIPMYKVEDKYDVAKDALEKSLEENSGDLQARMNAIMTFANTLRGLSNSNGLSAAARNSLLTEANLYETGEAPTGRGNLTYGEFSGNTPMNDSTRGIFADSNAALLISPQLDSKAPSIAQALADIHSEQTRFNNGNGMVYIDGITGTRVATASAQNISSFGNGQGMAGLALVTSGFGAGNNATIQHKATYARYRVLNPEISANLKKINENTLGWITAIPGKDGVMTYIVTKVDGGGNETILTAAGSAAVFDAIGGLNALQRIGTDNLVAFISSGSKNDWNVLINANNDGSTSKKTTDIMLGTGDVWTALSDMGYSFVNEFESASIATIKGLIKKGDLVIVNGQISVKTTVGGSTTLTDITDMLDDTLRETIISATAPSTDKPGMPDTITPPNEGGAPVPGGGGNVGMSGGNRPIPKNIKDLFDETKRRSAEKLAMRDKLMVADAQAEKDYLAKSRENRSGMPQRTATPTITGAATPKMNQPKMQNTQQMSNPWIASFLRHMPTPDISKTTATATGSSGIKLQGVERVARKNI